MGPMEILLPAPLILGLSLALARPFATAGRARSLVSAILALARGPGFALLAFLALIPPAALAATGPAQGQSHGQSHDQIHGQIHGQGQADEAWQVVGELGRLQVVILPEARARDVAAYERQIARLCVPGQTCFINFHTNSTGAPPALPLPEAISREVTARFRRSMKGGREMMEWSCRLQLPDLPCF